MKYHFAGYWIRVLATVIDIVLFTALDWLLVTIAPQVYINVGIWIGSKIPDTIQLVVADTFKSDTLEQVLGYAYMLPLVFLYYVAMHSSKFQASLGEWICGLKIINCNGERLSAYKAADRFCLKEMFFFGASLSVALTLPLDYNNVNWLWIPTIFLFIACLCFLGLQVFAHIKMGWHPYKQGWFDSWAQTYMIRVNQNPEKVKYLPGTDPELQIEQNYSETMDGSIMSIEKLVEGFRISVNSGLKNLKNLSKTIWIASVIAALVTILGAGIFAGAIVTTIWIFTVGMAYSDENDAEELELVMRAKRTINSDESSNETVNVKTNQESNKNDAEEQMPESEEITDNQSDKTSDETSGVNLGKDKS